MLRRLRRGTILLGLLLLMACNSAPKYDYSIYVMPSGSYGHLDPAPELNAYFAERLAPATVNVKVSSFYSPERLTVESQLGMHSIYILPSTFVEGAASNGGMYLLDEHFDKAQFPDGVFRTLMRDKNGQSINSSGLYGIPVAQMPSLRQLSFYQPSMVAVIRSNIPEAKRIAAIQLLKELVER